MVEIARIALRTGHSGTSAGAGMLAIPRCVGMVSHTQPVSSQRVHFISGGSRRWAGHRCAPGEYNCRAGHGYRRFHRKNSAPWCLAFATVVDGASACSAYFAYLSSLHK
jgi:hypothetical protein